MILSSIRHFSLLLALLPSLVAASSSSGSPGGSQNIRQEFVRAMNEATHRKEESMRQTALMSRLLKSAKVVKTAFVKEGGNSENDNNNKERKLDYNYNYNYGYYNYQENYNNYNNNNNNGNNNNGNNNNNNNQQEMGDDAFAAYGGLNLTNYALKYLGCQNIHTYNDEIAADNNGMGVLALNRFVVFRLCPKKSCSNYNAYGCDYNYGEYTMPMDDYLATMQEYHIQQYQTYCKTCAACMTGKYYEVEGQRERDLANNNGGGGQYYYYNGRNYYNNYGNANNDDNYNANDDAANYQQYNGNYDDFYAANNDDGNGGGGGDDDNGGGDDDDGNGGSNMTAAEASCAYRDVCAAYQEACGPEMYNDDNYYANAENYQEFFECSEFNVGGAEMYLGPHCRSDGFTIGIGIYADEYCSSYMGDVVDMQQVTGMQYEDDYLSPYYPKQCISCTARESYDLLTDDEIENEENEGLYEVCGYLYEQAAKCNRYLGEDDTYIGQYQQEANEGDVCNFVASLVENNYDEYGEAVLESPEWTLSKWKSLNAYKQDIIRTSSGQILAICFSVGLVLALSIYSVYLRYKLTRRLPWSRVFGSNQAAEQAGRLGRVSSGITMQRSLSNLEPTVQTRGSFA